MTTLLPLMKLPLALVFVGWLVMWVMMPTSTYTKTWKPNLLANTNSTYFGGQGTIMLIWTFPILFIAVVGCFYLHFEKKSGNIRGSLRRRLEAWSKPVLVKGPLGIVSAIELTFFSMFLALLIWSFAAASVVFANLEDRKTKTWQSQLGAMAARLGAVGNICLSFLFFPVARGSSLLPLVGLTSESSIKYHAWLGHVAMVLLTAHGACFVVLFAATNHLSEMLQWEKVGASILAGELSLLSGLLMWATTYSRIRRKNFELFYYTHHLYILFLIFYIFHLRFAHFCFNLPGVYLFMVDRYLRFLQSRSKVSLVSARLLPSEIVELNFSKSPGFSYNPLSIVFVNVPSISSLQWHPFSVSSSSKLEPERLSIIIKKEGSWTSKLHQILVSSPTRLDRLAVSVEGPHGPNSVDFLRYDSLVMVSGGSGITPFIAIIRELIYHSKTPESQIPSVYLISSFRTSADLTMLDLLLPISFNASDLSRLKLQVEAFVTREKSPPDASKHIQTVWFKPLASDLPIAPVLGPNGWLWLGAIVSSSFVAFLVLLGILTRYFIYPIDHNTDLIFSYTARAALNLVLLCVSIASTATAAVLWNKRRNAVEAKKHLDASKSGETLSSTFNNTDRELESFPKESILQATTFHFGERPDLKKMLAKLDGTNIGVMASGPGALRHEVAAICSSGLANNLHFESISFTF